MGIIDDLKKLDFEETLNKAKTGDAKALNDIGKCYHYGVHVEKDFAQSFKWIKSSADKGFTNAIYDLGFLYYYGRGVAQDYKKAEKYFKLASDKGHASACGFLGDMYFIGLLGEPNYKKAVECFIKASEKGDRVSMYNLFMCYMNGYGVKVDEEKGMYYLKESAKKGNPQAQHVLGENYFYGSHIEKDKKEAKEWFLKALDNGYVKSCYFLGNISIYEENNVKEGLYFYELGAENNEINSIRTLAYLYLNENEYVKKDIDKAISYFKKAADLDDVQSFYELGKLLLMNDKIKDGISYLDKASSHGSEDSSLILGELYESGEFVTKDYKKAFKYFKRALDQNEVSSASYDLGRFYLFGVGVEENINKAISYFKKAIPSNSYACFYLYSIYTNPRFNHVDEEKAMKYLKKGVELNDFACLLNLGTCYLDGIGVKQNYKKAFELYIKSYNTRKTSHALHNIANCYYYGYGTKKDVNMAIKYFKALKKEGYKPAIDFLNKIGK